MPFPLQGDVVRKRRCGTDVRPGRIRRRPFLAVAACAALGSGTVTAGELASSALVDLTLEQLSNVVVTSVSRREERLVEAPASVFVITADDIRRSGVTRLPDALRLAPNLHVARAEANNYSISARGFNNGLNNKLLVLLDGRILYSPLFSGVFWDAQHVMLEDIERIEIISGPGTTLYGANAVNGVINIISHPAGQTQGALASAGGGNQERATVARYGGRLGESGQYRVYGKVQDRDGTRRANGTPVIDSSEHGQVGFRADWGGLANSFTVQGDAYRGDIDQPIGGSRNLGGANVIARWNRQFDDGGTLRLQGYYDRVERDQPGSLREKLDIFDLEAHHGLRPLGAHRFLVGAGYRYAHDRTDAIPGAPAFLPRTRSLDSWNVFVHDEIALATTVDLTLGVKLDHNDYTGIEVLPNARLAWRPRPDRLLWTAMSRAVRAPSRVDLEFFTEGPPATALRGGPTFESEVAKVVEVGYRAQASSALSYSITAFRNYYDKLRSIEPVVPGFQLQNRIEGTSHGVEAWGSVRVNPLWRLTAGITELRQNFRLEPGSASVGGVTSLGNDPKRWLMVRSSFDITPRHELDLMIRHVGALPSPAVPSYTAIDARFGWRLTRQLELSLTVQNALDSSHPETGTPATRSEFERAFFLKALWRQ